MKRSRVCRPHTDSLTLPLYNEYDTDKGKERVTHLASIGCFMGKPPFGLWYQVDDSWEVWCMIKKCDWIGDYKTTFDVDHSRMLVIATQEELLRFGQNYGIPISNCHVSIIQSINWEKVMADYDGMEISNNYHFNCLGDLELMWYHGWDVASGVVWNADKCISNVEFENIENHGF